MKWEHFKSLLVFLFVILGFVGCSPDIVEFDAIDNEESDDMYTQDIVEEYEVTFDQIEEKYICTTLVSLEWGKNSDQIGYFINESTKRITGFHSPIF